MAEENFQFDQDKEWQKYQDKTYWDQAEHMPVLVQLLIKTGLKRRTAYYVLFGILIISSFATFEIIRKTFFPSSNSQTIYLEDVPKEILNTLPPEVVKQFPSKNAR